MIGATALALWSGIMSFLFFYVLLKIGRLRLNPLFEVIGADFMEFGSVNDLARNGIGKINKLNRESVNDIVRKEALARHQG